MLKPCVYPAAVTPFDEKGRVDIAQVAKLLAWFEANGCAGAVLAGTNGEGPSLSATEKRDLIEAAVPLRGKLDVILGIATPSLEEAAWLCRRAYDSGAVAVLVMAPFYFRDVPEAGIEKWFSSLLDRSPIPVIVYNFPQKTGITLSAQLVGRLGTHANMAGVKDSSGNADNLSSFRRALVREDQRLFVGDECLLLDAMREGWSGSISGASNVIPLPISMIVKDFLEGREESAEAKFEIALPVIQAIRSSPQPASHKMVLKEFGVLTNSAVRLPLIGVGLAEVSALIETIREQTGLPGPVATV